MLAVRTNASRASNRTGDDTVPGTVERFVSSDHPGHVEDPALYRYYHNNPVNAVDPSGLDPDEPKKLFTIEAHEDYPNYPLDVFDVDWIVWDTILSGMKDQKAREASPWRAFVLGGGRTYFEAMQTFCKNQFGAGWEPVPVKFRLTGLKFHEKGKLHDYIGNEIEITRPRTEKITIPAFVDGKVAEIETTKKVEVGHFYISGYWIFKCHNANQNKDSDLFGIDTEGKAIDLQHSPYGKEWSTELKAAKAQWLKDRKDPKTDIIIGQAHVDQIVRWSAERFQLLKDAGLEKMIEKYLEVKPGDKGADLKIIKLSDPKVFGEKFVWWHK
jgi:hypothetical protein